MYWHIVMVTIFSWKNKKDKPENCLCLELCFAKEKPRKILHLL